jgi:hypothetical protein
MILTPSLSPSSSTSHGCTHHRPCRPCQQEVPREMSAAMTSADVPPSPSTPRSSHSPTMTWHT